MPDVQYWSRRLLQVLRKRDDWILIRYPLHDAIDKLPELPSELVLCRDRELLTGYADQPQRTERIWQRLENKHELGLGLKLDGQLVYDTWIWRGSYKEPNTGLLLQPDEPGGVLLDSWTHPDFRGRGLHLRMIYQRLERARAEGMLSVQGLVHGGNLPAQLAQYRAGAEFVEWITVTHGLLGRSEARRRGSWHELALDKR